MVNNYEAAAEMSGQNRECIGSPYGHRASATLKGGRVVCAKCGSRLTDMPLSYLENRLKQMIIDSVPKAPEPSGRPLLGPDDLRISGRGKKRKR